MPETNKLENPKKRWGTRLLGKEANMLKGTERLANGILNGISSPPAWLIMDETLCAKKPSC